MLDTTYFVLSFTNPIEDDDGRWVVKVVQNVHDVHDNCTDRTLFSVLRTRYVYTVAYSQTVMPFIKITFSIYRTEPTCLFSVMFLFIMIA